MKQEKERERDKKGERGRKRESARGKEQGREREREKENKLTLSSPMAFWTKKLYTFNLGKKTFLT